VSSWLIGVNCINTVNALHIFTVKYNIKRMGKKEFVNLRFQFGTSSWGGSRIPPMAFTEQGVAMLSNNK